MWFNRKPKVNLCIALISLVLVVIPTQLSWFDNFEANTWDWRVSAFANPNKASDEVCVILLDQASLDWVKNENEIGWPWPREFYSYIVEYCRLSKAKSLGFDVLFTEDSQYSEEDDKSFAKAIKDFGYFTLASRAVNGKSSNSNTVEHLTIEQAQNLNVRVREFQGMDMPVDLFLKNAQSLASVNSSPDQDGVNRRISLFNKVDSQNIPILGLATFLASEKERSFEEQAGKLIVNGKVIPLDSEGKALLNFRGPSKTHRVFSAQSILQSYALQQEGKTPVVSPSLLEGKYILFGFSAPGLHDQHNVPLGEKYPGVEVHATFIDNLLNEDFYTPLASIYSYIFAFISAFLVAMVFVNSNSYLKQIVFSGVMLVLPIVVALGAASAGYKIALFFPTVATTLALFQSVGYNYMTEGKQKKFIKYAFRHYLSPHVIDELIENPDKLKLGGVRSEISIFFSDLEGFTSISERLEPEVLIEVLNEYLSEMSDIILEESGTIDKYEGDAIIAFWNAPLPVENHAAQIVKSALRCQQALAEMNPQLKGRAGVDLKMRIGIHTGPAVVGNMGASERFDYTMLGDAVNLAARLEGVNKQFGTYTLISIDTKNQMGDIYPTRELAKVEVVGRKEPVRVFEPMMQEEFDAKKEYIEKFLTGLNLFYEEKFAEALEVFKENHENDPPSKKYVAKCQDLIDSGKEAPKGVWVMTSK